MSVFFFFVFAAFNTLQTFEAVLNPSSGILALALLYLSFSIANLLIAVPIVSFVGDRASLLLGASTYLFFIATHLIHSDVLLLLSSVVIGVGAAVLWTAHGAYLSRHGDAESFGQVSGLFFSIFMGHLSAGQLFAAGFFALAGNQGDASAQEKLFVAILCAIACVSVCFWLKLDTFERVNAPAGGSGEKSVRENVLETGKLFGNRFLQILLPLLMFSGQSQAMFYAIIPPRVGANNRSRIGLVMAVFGFTQVFAAIIAGKLGDSIGRLFLLSTGVVIAMFGSALSLLFGYSDAAQFCGAMFMGVGDACLNSNIFALLSTLFPHSNESAFAFWKLVQSSNTGIILLISLTTSFSTTLLFFNVFGVFSLLSLAAMAYKNPIELRKKQSEAKERLVAAREEIELEKEDLSE